MRIVKKIRETATLRPLLSVGMVAGDYPFKREFLLFPQNR